MKQFTKYCYVFPACLALSACSFFGTQQNARLCADDNGNFSACQELSANDNVVLGNTNMNASHVHFVQLNEYTQRLAKDLSADLPPQGLANAILVRPFEYIGNAQTHNDVLNERLTEYMAGSLRDLGVLTSDKALNNFLYFTEAGEVEYSIEQHQVMEELGTGYIMLGKLLNSQNGMMLSVKVVDLKNGHLIASANKFFPNLILQRG